MGADVRRKWSEREGGDEVGYGKRRELTFIGST